METQPTYKQEITQKKFYAKLRGEGKTHEEAQKLTRGEFKKLN
jgi:hypothetical protein